MSSSFAYEDPLIRQQQQAIGAISTSTTAKAREIFTEMGRGMWRSGKGFAKVTVLFAGTECVIESVGRFPPIGTDSGVICKLETDMPDLACAVSGSERYRKCGRGWVYRWRRPGTQHWPERCAVGRTGILSILGSDRPVPAARASGVSASFLAWLGSDLRTFPQRRLAFLLFIGTQS